MPSKKSKTSLVKKKAASRSSSVKVSEEVGESPKRSPSRGEGRHEAVGPRSSGAGKKSTYGTHAKKPGLVGKGTVAQSSASSEAQRTPSNKASTDSQRRRIARPSEESALREAGQPEASPAPELTNQAARSAFVHRPNRNQEEKSYQQGALFMDDYETFQERAGEESGAGAERSLTNRYSSHEATPSVKSRNWPEEACENSSDEAYADDDDEFLGNEGGPSVSNLGQLSVKLSSSLHRKLIHKAAAEGVSVDDFAAELLAEGLVLRAWEIMERKSAMRAGSTGNSYQPGGRQQQNRYGFRNPGPNNNSYNNNNRSRPAHNGAGGGGNHLGNGAGPHGNTNRRMNYNQIMDDNANFLEYVRSQEKKQR